MASKDSDTLKLEFHPLTPDRWADLEALFGQHGASGGCWCMWWRLSRQQFTQQTGEGNRKALKSLVNSGTIPGILAYACGRPVGWCALGPREAYPTLARSRLFKPVDDKSAWSVVCFYVARPFRHRGVTAELLRAAIEHVRSQGGTIVEGYPVEPKSGYTPDPYVYTGRASAFRKAGFVEVLRRSETRPIMRYYIKQGRG